MKHGTVYAYRKHKCHCELCRAAHTEQMRAYRIRRRDRTMVGRSDLVQRIELLEATLRWIDGAYARERSDHLLSRVIREALEGSS
jgi:hypothetical protein